VLVANRGEIAIRIFRTARQMGLRTVAVYVEADRGSLHVEAAHAAVRLPSGSYLDQDAIIDAARRTGADAIHPGYGFLSENASFAGRVEAEGLIWVGPPASCIADMGDKLRSKRLAEDAGVPTLPFAEPDPEAPLTAAETVGYPLLVKASAGGGGKGMRVVAHPSELAESIAAARREALAAFGDDRLFFERYVPRSRHVEVQIVGDSHGGVFHLGERECSIQRRHQKLVEEAPSPAVTPALRDAMTDAATKLARAIGYRSLGTVEFLLDDATHEFFFLEMNTRLQVEHPVTEETTGIDLVREQLRIAGGHAFGGLPESRETPREQPAGWAIEARLNAEDPAGGFLPATGTFEIIRLWRRPCAGTWAWRPVERSAWPSIPWSERSLPPELRGPRRRCA
jgi:propionyl-CoA carboxylase alpha chain